jgi:hypothetical protein
MEVQMEAKSRGSVFIETVPLPEDTVKGGIVIDGKKFFLKVGRKRIELTPGLLASRGELKALAGSDVAVVFSRRKAREIVAIGTWPTPERPRVRRPKWIICYLPAPDFMRRTDPYMRKELLWAFEREGVIDREVADLVRSKMMRR